MGQTSRRRLGKVGAVLAGGLASMVALFGWSMLVSASAPRSALRYVVYWSTMVYVPAALVGVPYLFTRRVWPGGKAVVAAVGCALAIVALFVAWVALALIATSTLTF